jgi:glycosyltransferase involved in cell wall biosynthesis
MHRAPLVVFSHLRWNFVYQRPQHVMTRMGERRDVLFVEEPLHHDGEPWLEIASVSPGVRVCRPHLSEPGPAFGPAQQPTLERLLRDHFDRERVREIVAWLYTPMAIRLARAFKPRGIVYDCMDELSAFLGAPPELIERERELLAHADVVFTGGPSLYRAKSRLHSFVRCFPSSVDVAHFARATHATEPGDQSSLPRPRIGYCGVIDERLDPGIIEALASAHPEWSVVMIGPVVKIDPSTLPRRDNLHWLGQRNYDQLPEYFSGWDVCTMPFAINEATRFISPTKVLEYMAAGRPIVSTPITDVVEPYGDIVHVGDRPETFVAACERALGESAAARAEREARAQRVLQRTSWNETVHRMDEILHFLADYGVARQAPLQTGTTGASVFGARA